jgi:hypothetical protein
MGSHRKKLKNFWERVTSSYRELLNMPEPPPRLVSGDPVA